MLLRTSFSFDDNQAMICGGFNACHGRWGDKNKEYTITSWCTGSLWLVLQLLQLPSASTVKTVAILLFAFSNTIIIAAQHPEIQVCYNIISNDDVRSGTSAHRVTITEPVSVRRERLFPTFFSLTGCQQCWEHWLTSPPSHSQEKTGKETLSIRQKPVPWGGGRQLSKLGLTQPACLTSVIPLQVRSVW